MHANDADHWTQKVTAIMHTVYINITMLMLLLLPIGVTVLFMMRVNARTSNYINNTISVEVFKVVQKPPLGKLVRPCGYKRCSSLVAPWSLNVWSLC